MFYIYILITKNRQLYTGFTENLKNRIRQHQTGSVESTRSKRPLKFIPCEGYLLESDARRREKFLKTTEGKRLLRMQLRDILRQERII